MKSIKDKAELVLREEKRNYETTDGWRKEVLGSFNLARGDGWGIRGQERVLIINTPSTNYLKSPKADLLLKLYAALDLSGKKEFEDILIEHLDHTSEFAMISYLPLFVLHRIGKVVPAMQKIIIAMHMNYYGDENARSMLSKILNYEWHLFSEEDLEEIDKIVDNSYSLKDRINSIGIALLEKELENVNQEINQDKEELKKEFQKYKFPQDLSDTLNKIDSKFNTATDQFDYKGCMDLIRSFTERFYESVAKGLGEDGRKLDVADSEAVGKFFHEKGLISGDQKNLLKDLRHFLSNSGSHRLKSLPEDARLSRNMTIEFSLYILRRYEQVKQ